jgi:4-hydroxythreonine-4-phosphate dehydrogenase
MKPLAITCGDPAGVGLEIIEQWLGGQSSPPNLELIGPRSWLDALPETVSKQAVGERDYCPISGTPDATGAQIAWDAMKLAAAGCREGRYAGVVTGPVSKSELAAVGYPHPGQTEFFAAEWGGEPVMAFHSDHLRVTLATWHVPLAEVPKYLTADAVERAVHAAAQLAQADGIVDPRIAVCGLNPHAGEAGLLGSDELERINPLLDQLRQNLPGLSVCLPGDTVFGRALKGEFDAVVAMYHDQGLGPLKTIDFDNAVNVTLGLPHVRTSPDHGTGFDIAGKGIASATSFGRAVDLAEKLAAAKSS